MPTQYQIERAAGIDSRIAQYMMEGKTAAANTAMSALRLLVAHYDHCAMGLLEAAVAECRREIT